MKNSFVLSVQDISCIGQCSLTVALPVLSAMGHECAILPTSLLSSHTAFKHTSICRLENEFPKIFDAWEAEGIRFDGIYTGYIGSVDSVRAVKSIFSRFLKPNAPVIVDPVFGDHGKLYRHFNADYVDEVRALVASADVILPNLTEACFLTDTPYKESFDNEEIALLHEKLRRLGAKRAIVTSIRCSEDRIAFSIDDGKKLAVRESKHINRPSHGAGDVFASIVAGRVFSNQSLFDAACEAAAFVQRTLEQTPPDHWYGLGFEPFLSELMKN